MLDRYQEREGEIQVASYHPLPLSPPPAHCTASIFLNIIVERVREDAHCYRPNNFASNGGCKCFGSTQRAPFFGHKGRLRYTSPIIKGRTFVRRLKGWRECSGQHDMVVTVDMRMVWVKGRRICYPSKCALLPCLDTTPWSRE